MQHDQTDLKKNAFVALRDAGHTFDEIRRALGCSERTLYLWQNQIEDDQYQEETQQATEIVENKQQIEIDELKERIEQLSNSYTNLWNQVHLQQQKPAEEDPFQIFFEVMMENSEKNTILLNQHLDKCREIEMEMEAKGERWSKPDTYRDLHFTEHIEQMKQWNKRFDIENGRDPTNIVETEDLKGDIDEPQLMMETTAGRRFEQNIAERCFKREVSNIVDEIIRRNSRLETS